MENNKNASEYDILGFRLKVTAERHNDVSAQEVVAYVNKQVSELQKQYPQFSCDKIAVLLALQMAEERLVLEKEYFSNVTHIEEKAKKALGLLGEFLTQ
jgi:cell division protein ZapA (FtsZ GTPase activity inhibitor)